MEAMQAPRHAWDFRLRRFLNWFPLGWAYASMYMGRYNLNVAQKAIGNEVMSLADFGQIFGYGAVVYALSFVVNGPITDRYGGRRAMLIGTFGSLVANLLMGLVLLGASQWGWQVQVFPVFVALYCLNMYFQSFGAAAVVTVKAPWFHVRERGQFSTIFGVMISCGTYFAFDWGYGIMAATRGTLTEPKKLGLVSRVFRFLVGTGGTGVNQDWWLFFTPAIFLTAGWLVMLFLLRNTPGEAGHRDFETGQANLTAHGERLPVFKLFWRIITHRVLGVVCGIAICTGVLRNATMQWYPKFAEAVGFKSSFWVTSNWGFTLLLSGVLGGFLTGWVSDRFFQSRRGPMMAFLYSVSTVAVLIMATSLTATPWVVGGAVVVIFVSVIGVHSVMAGTVTADFGGRNSGAAVGIVDGLVYFGIAIQSFAAGLTAPVAEAAKNPAAWIWLPGVLIPFVVVGVLLSTRIWHAQPAKVQAH